MAAIDAVADVATRDCATQGRDLAAIAAAGLPRAGIILLAVCFAGYAVFLAFYSASYASGSDASGYFNSARLLAFPPDYVVGRLALAPNADRSVPVKALAARWTEHSDTAVTPQVRSYQFPESWATDQALRTAPSLSTSTSTPAAPRRAQWTWAAERRLAAA